MAQKAIAHPPRTCHQCCGPWSVREAERVCEYRVTSATRRRHTKRKAAWRQYYFRNAPWGRRGRESWALCTLYMDGGIPCCIVVRKVPGMDKMSCHRRGQWQEYLLGGVHSLRGTHSIAYRRSRMKCHIDSILLALRRVNAHPDRLLYLILPWRDARWPGQRPEAGSAGIFRAIELVPARAPGIASLGLLLFFMGRSVSGTSGVHHAPQDELGGVLPRRPRGSAP